MRIINAKFSRWPKVDLRSFALAVDLEMKDFTCIHQALYLCSGKLAIKALQLIIHPRIIFTPSAAPSASFLSSAIKFYLGIELKFGSTLWLI